MLKSDELLSKVTSIMRQMARNREFNRLLAKELNRARSAHFRAKAKEYFAAPKAKTTTAELDAQIDAMFFNNKELVEPNQTDVVPPEEVAEE